MCRYAKILFAGLLFAAFVAAPSPANARPAQTNIEQQQVPRDSERHRQWLEKEVRHELVMLPYYSVFDNLAYRVDGDRVELFGQVVRPTLRSDAEAVVKKIEGVVQVVNKIEVLPASPMDDRLRLTLYRAIYGDAALFRYSVQAVPPIHIIVKHGNVTLEGVVNNATEKTVAALRANSVSGIFSVTNHLQVEK